MLSHSDVFIIYIQVCLLSRQCVFIKSRCFCCHVQVCLLYLCFLSHQCVLIKSRQKCSSRCVCCQLQACLFLTQVCVVNPHKCCVVISRRFILISYQYYFIMLHQFKKNFFFTYIYLCFMCIRFSIVQRFGHFNVIAIFLTKLNIIIMYCNIQK